MMRSPSGYRSADELHEAGYRVMEAGNAEEALNLLYSGAVPALLMTDIRMPGAHDGIAPARQAYPEIEIVIVLAPVDRIKWLRAARDRKR